MYQSPYRRAAKKPKRRGRALSIAIVLVSTVYSATLLAWPLQAAEATAVPQKGQAIAASKDPVALPAYGQAALSATGYGLLASSPNADQAVPIASITKLVTALTILEAKPLLDGQDGPVITFTEQDEIYYRQYLAKNGVVLRSDVGLQLTQSQVMHGLLMASANNYADTLAVWSYGSMEKYLAAANTFLISKGLSKTKVADASGFSPDSMSSAEDLVKLGTLALEHPVVAEIVAKKSVIIPGVGTVRSTNKLLGSGNAIGLKTGTTDEAGNCLLFASRHLVAGKEIVIVGAVLDAPSHPALFRDAAKLLDDVQRGFRQTTIVKAGQSFGSYVLPWGESAQAVTQENITEVIWTGHEITQMYSMQEVMHGSMGTDIGTATFSAGKKQYTVPLVLDQTIEGPSWQWRLTHPLEVLDT